MTVEMSCILTVGSAVLSCAVLSAMMVFHCFVCALLFLTVVRLLTVCYWTGLSSMSVDSPVSRVSAQCLKVMTVNCVPVIMKFVSQLHRISTVSYTHLTLPTSDGV